MFSEDIVYCKSYGSFEIQHHKRTGVFNMPSYHNHGAYELYYLLSGDRLYIINDETIHIHKGDLVLVNAHDMHKTVNGDDDGHERIVINFTREFLTHFIHTHDINLFGVFRNHVVPLGLYEQSVVESILRKIISETEADLIGTQTNVRIALIELLVLLNRCVSQQHTVGSLPVNCQGIREQTPEIVDYIYRNYMNHLTLREVADLFFISPCYLSRVFKRKTGLTFVEHSSRVRVREAKRLLTNTSFSVMQVAEMVGYDNSTHFGRVFKSATGSSPSLYRMHNTAKSIEA